MKQKTIDLVSLLLKSVNTNLLNLNKYNSISNYQTKEEKQQTLINI